MEKVGVRIEKRGIKAGMLTFFAGPPLGGAAFGLVTMAGAIIGKVAGATELPTVGEVLSALLALLLMPILTAIWSFLLAALPAAMAAIYVSIRVGTTERLSWAETVVLSVICLAFTLGTNERNQYDFLLRPGKEVLIFVPYSLFAALTLRYLAGRWGLVR